TGVEDASSIEAYGTEVDGHVIAINETECDEADAELNEQLQVTVCGDVVVHLLTGEHADEEAIVDIPSGPGAPVVEVGDDVILLPTPDSVSGQQYHIIDHDRSSALWALAIAFALAVVAFGRWKGVRSLVSLALTFAVVLLFMVPAILDGSSPILVAVVGSAAIMLVSLYLGHGWNRT
ncbi:hypothetical protein ADL26_05485, partial [Thermoactinomyces vulgaris]